MISRRIAWIGSLSLGLAACSGQEETDSVELPPPFAGGSAAGSGSTPAPTGSGGQTGAAPLVGTPTGESGPPITGGLAGSGPGPVAAAGDAGSLPPPALPDAGPALPPPDDGTVVDGPVGEGPSSLPAPPGDANVPRPSGAPATDITVLNWAGFTGAVTYSFDDNNQSQIQNYDTLNALDVPFTFYLWTGQQSATNPVWARALQDGHEIGNHTQSHNPGTCTAGDINTATTFIQNNLGVRPLTMAAPNGDACYKGAGTGLFFINRGVGPKQPVMPNDNSDPLNLNCYIPNPGQQSGVYNGDINAARTQGGWVIYVIHGFTGDPNAYQPGDVNQLTAAINYTRSLGDMWIGTMVDVGAYWLGQKALSQKMMSQTGEARTWTWTLPGQFPPGKYVRARVTGGTLTQNGQPLTWDPHGYYEIALDARSVTLTP